MAEKHTPEPWGGAGIDIVVPPLDVNLLKADPDGHVTLVARFEREEDARRAVACVNALRVVPQPALEGDVEREYRTDEGGVHSITIRWRGPQK